jgi:hypothetical protein
MDFIINARSEGRVLIPWETQKYPNITTIDLESEFVFADFIGQTHKSLGTRSAQSTLHLPDWRGQGSVWEAYRYTCPPGSPARRVLSSIRSTSSHSATPYFELPSTPFDSDFRFVRDVDGRFNFCQNPWAHTNQGHFYSDWRTVPLPFPILSPAKAHGFGDIRIPSHYYHGTTRRYTYAWDEVNLELKQLDNVETPWAMKDEKLFFRGATTGGGSSPPGFSREYQRHRQLYPILLLHVSANRFYRFVRMATMPGTDNRTIVFADPPSSSNYVFTKMPETALADVLDVAFVSSVDHVSYPGGLQQQMVDHRFDDAVLLRDHWSHKYILDLDGASYSGKFFAYLASDSAVVKSSIYTEFYSDWIQPWYVLCLVIERACL